MHPKGSDFRRHSIKYLKSSARVTKNFRRRRQQKNKYTSKQKRNQNSFIAIIFLILAVFFAFQGTRGIILSILLALVATYLMRQKIHN